MVPTHVLLAAMAALAEPAPTPALAPPDDFLTARGEQMRFLHPVATNPYMPASQPAAHHTDQPKRNGGGGRGGSGSGGSKGSSGTTSGTSSSQSLAALEAALLAAQQQAANQQAANQQAANGTPGQPTPTGGVGHTLTDSTTPTDPITASVLPNPTAQTPAAVVATPDLFTPPTPATTGGSTTTAPVVSDGVSPTGESPVSTPEPGTILLFTLAAGLGGGTAVRKWIRRKKG